MSMIREGRASSPRLPSGAECADVYPPESKAFHVICERDVGLFSLIQQVIANVTWAAQKRCIPVVYFQDKTCYWTEKGYCSKNTVWEYYFEPVVQAYSASCIPKHVREVIRQRPPSPFDLGYYADECTFVSSHFGDHPALAGKALSIPYLLDDPGPELRRRSAEIIRRYVRPRDFIKEKVTRFFQRHMSQNYLIGVHARGTDAISPQEVRPHRQGSLNLEKYVEVIRHLLIQQPTAQIFVATDSEASLYFLQSAFPGRVIACEAIRHQTGEAAAQGPTGWIMPAYFATDRDRAARNGEDAVVEYLLLSQCDFLVHNASSLARTVLLKVPGLPHVNTHPQVGRDRDAVCEPEAGRTREG